MGIAECCMGCVLGEVWHGVWDKRLGNGQEVGEWAVVLGSLFLVLGCSRCGSRLVKVNPSKSKLIKVAGKTRPQRRRFAARSARGCAGRDGPVPDGRGNDRRDACATHFVARTGSGSRGLFQRKSK